MLYLVIMDISENVIESKHNHLLKVPLTVVFLVFLSPDGIITTNIAFELYCD